MDPTKSEPNSKLNLIQFKLRFKIPTSSALLIKLSKGPYNFSNLWKS